MDISNTWSRPFSCPVCAVVSWEEHIFTVTSDTQIYVTFKEKVKHIACVCEWPHLQSGINMALR